LDDPAAIERKIKRAVTDNDNEVSYDREKKPGLANLLDLLAAATGEVPSEVAERYERYGELKSDVAAAVIEMLAPLQERYATISADPGAVLDVLSLGATKAASIADVTYRRAAEAIGLLAPR
jgi:tryptophanyl-tRNA synthetase